MEIESFQVAAIALVCSSKDISVVNSCELQTALESLNLNYTPSCKYNTIKEKSDFLYGLGMAALCLNGTLFLALLCISLWSSENKKIGLLLVYITVSTVLSFNYD